jgi:hypothetical protein
MAEASRQSRSRAWATLRRLRKFLEENGARITMPDDRNFETEGEAIESGLRPPRMFLSNMLERPVGISLET